MNPLLSIIIPNYNNGIYLEECLKEIVNQTYRPLEAIVVDDCSTDNSRDIINEYSKKYTWIKGIYLDKNGGVSHARNVGAKNASGEYISFLDSDDYYMNAEKSSLEMNMLLGDFSEEGRGRVAFSNLIAVDKTGNVLWKYPTKRFLKGSTVKKIFLENSGIQLPKNYCMKRGYHDEIGGFDEESCLYEDIDYLLKLAGIADFYCTEAAGSSYRITGTGLSSAAKESHRIAVSSLRKKYKKDFTKTECLWIEIRFRVKSIYNAMKQFAKRSLFKRKEERA